MQKILEIKMEIQLGCNFDGEAIKKAQQNADELKALEEEFNTKK